MVKVLCGSKTDWGRQTLEPQSMTPRNTPYRGWGARLGSQQAHPPLTASWPRRAALGDTYDDQPR